jgi:HTH-type transcriptional regulator/antitoxin HigA
MEIDMETLQRAGELIRAELKRQGMSQAELSRRSGRPMKTICEIVNGKAAITATTAIQLERCLGIPASELLRLQGEYDLWVARQKLQSSNEL